MKKNIVWLIIAFLPSLAMASSQQLYEQVIVNDAKMAKSSTYKLLLVAYC